MTLLKPGAHLRSRVCTTEVIVIRAPAREAVISCGGQPMVDRSEQVTPAGAPPGDGHGGTLLGKRYADDELGLELLCVKGGSGQLTVDGRVLHPREARPLPASD